MKFTQSTDRARAPLAALVLFAATIAAASTASPTATGTGGGTGTEELVRIELVSDLAAVRAGEEFWLALRFEIQEHWHVYWENAGDSGLPTTVELEAPEGFEIGPPRYPGPRRFELPGEIVSYGYEDEVLVFFRAQAPAELAPESTLRFRAKARWLVCQEACFLGQEEAGLTLRAAATDSPAAPSKQSATLEPWLARLPRPLAELAGATAELRGSAGSPELWLALPRPEGEAAIEVRYFPAEERGLELRGASQLAEAGRTTLVRKFRFHPPKEGLLPQVRGVVELALEGGSRFYELELAWPAPEGGSGGGR